MNGADVLNERLAAFEALVDALEKVPAAMLVGALVKVCEEARKGKITRHAAGKIECASASLEAAAIDLGGIDLLQTATNVAVRLGARTGAGFAPPTMARVRAPKSPPSPAPAPKGGAK